MDHLTEQEIEQVVAKAVKATLLSFGVDTSKPIEMQRDFQALRDWRTASESIRSKSVMTLISIIVAGTLAALWVGIRNGITGK